MQVASFIFCAFVLITLLITSLISPKYRYLGFLAASLLFYALQDARYLIVLGVLIVVTYVTGLLAQRYKKAAFISGILINVLVLGYFKYIGFFSGGKITSVFAPVGLSFYVFMAISYLADIYKGKIAAEKNFFKVALFLSFFPTVTSGPIERAGHLLPQFDEENMAKIRFDIDRIRDGFVRMLWGFVMKLVLADRISIMVGTVYDSPSKYSGSILALASILYTFQIYFDFAGYTHIVVGAGKVFGLEITENFNTPYLSRSIAEFWRRWHMSLSSWLKDYLYIPLGGNRKGTVRKYINVMIVFMVSGLWHGAGINFIIWGGLHGLYQVIGAVLKPVREKTGRLLHLREGGSAGEAIISTLFTFCLVNFAWIFFRVTEFKDIIAVMKGLMHPQLINLMDGTVYTLGVEAPAVVLTFIGILGVIVVDILNYRGIRISEKIAGERLWIRWPVYIAAIMLIAVCGVWGQGYDSTSFIYANF